MASFGLGELLAGMVEAFGAPRPTSFGLGELLFALEEAINGSIGAGSVSAETVPGGLDGNDGLVPLSNIENQPFGYLWGPAGQVYPTGGAPVDTGPTSILGPNYTVLDTDTPDAYDSSTGFFYTRCLSAQTGGPVWQQVNGPPPVINGGT